MAGDSSFDIVSKVDRQEVDNALGQAAREVGQRFDFKNTDARIAWSGEAIEMQAVSEERVKAVLDVELNEGQMLEDVKLAINGAKPIDFTGHCGSQMPTTDEIVEKILSMKEGK